MNLTFKEYIAMAQPCDTKARNQAEQRWNSVAKPLNSLGLLEKAITTVAGAQHNSKVDLSQKALVVMCSDNGVVEEGVTQSPCEVTAIVTENFAKGETCACNMARVAGVDVFPIDIGVARDLTVDGIIHKKIAYGTANMTKQPAMTREQAEAAIIVGIEMVHDLVQKGYKIIATGEMGIGNTTTSSAVASVLLELPVEQVTGRGAGLSSEGLERKINAISRAIQHNCPNHKDGVDVLAKVGGFDIAGMAGVFLGGAIYHVPIVMDGIISSVAALVAQTIYPHTKEYIVASHLSKEPAGQAIVQALELKPFLNCEMCLGEGTGALTAIPILEMANQVYRNMSTFEQIQVEQYQPLI